jgi:hypothetical protein
MLLTRSKPIHVPKSTVRVLKPTLREVGKKVKGQSISFGSSNKIFIIPMKKVLLSIAFIVISFLGFSQSVTILPTSTLGGTNSWLLNNSTNRLVAQGASNGIEANSFRGIGVSTYANPMFYSSNSSPTLFRYGAGLGTNSITQESSTASTQAGSSIEWKYYTDGATTPLSTLFGYSNNNFGISGSLSTTGIATFNSNATIMGAGAVRGKLFIGTTTTQPSNTGLEIQATNATLANPNIYIKSASTGMIRFAGTTGEEGIYNMVDPSGTASSANVRWTHISSASGNPQTTMMLLDGEGDLTAFGFTKLGGSGTDVPAIKTKLLTGTITAALATETEASLTTNVAHGLDWTKIVSVSIHLLANYTRATTPTSVSLLVPPAYADPRPGGSPSSMRTGYDYYYNFNATNIEIIRATDSNKLARIAGGGQPAYTATYRILITYTN